MKFLKNKKFWLSVAHIAVMGAGAAGVILFPPAAVLITPAAGALNALIPSPLTDTTIRVTPNATSGIQSSSK